MSYLFQVDRIIYERKGGGTMTLAEAFHAIRGTGNAGVCRVEPDGTVTLIYRRGLGSGASNHAQVLHNGRWFDMDRIRWRGHLTVRGVIHHLTTEAIQREERNDHHRRAA